MNINIFFKSALVLLVVIGNHIDFHTGEGMVKCTDNQIGNYIRKYSASREKEMQKGKCDVR